MWGFTWIAAGLSVVLASCTEETVEPAPEESPRVQVVYGDPLATQLVPFPSDRYTVPDASTRTGLRVRVDAGSTGDAFVASYPLVVQRLGELDGFSTTGGFALQLSAPIDGQRFAGAQGGTAFEALDPGAFTGPGSPLLLVDVDPDSPSLGATIGLLPRYFEQAKDDYYLLDELTLVARPAVPLAPGRRYAFFATSALTDLEGRPVVRSAAFEELMSGGGGEYEARVREAVSVLEAQVGVAAADVTLASVFTTESVHDELVALAEAARERPAPLQVEPWTVQQTGVDDDRLRFRGTFVSPEYRRESDGTFEIADGTPVPQSDVVLEVYLGFSDATFSGPRPVVIYQHGLGGDKDGSWGTSERLAEVLAGGVAVIAIDSPGHGFRGDGAEGIASSVFGYFGIDPDSGEFDIARARDNFRQMAADQLELVRFVQSLSELDLLPAGAPDGVPDLDVSQLLYIGHSFGSVQGPTLFALAPEVRHAVWNVGGDGLMFLLEDSGTFSLVVNGLRPPGTPDGALARFMSATQAIVDPGDPLNYAPFALGGSLSQARPAGPRSVLLQEVVGDNIVPNSSSHAVARAVGLGLMNGVVPVPTLEAVVAPVAGNVASGSTGVLCQFATMNGGEVASHGELIFAEEARAQYVELFRSALADGVGTVIAP
ncbi:MAG: alpha/beta fold hydrolase [Polyangiaceae bacterium]|nr:alpha/beta fold hydrolase [Polyangiaceae bacterium]